MSQLTRTVDDVLKASEDISGEITHVAAACFWHSLIGVDRDGKPTTKVLSWADNRSRDLVSVLRKKLDESEVHNRTGARFHSSFWPAKLLWLRKAQPEAFTQTAQWLSLSDFLSLIFDDSSTSISMASATGIFDIRKCEWDKPLLRSLKLQRSPLPQIAEPDQTFQLKPKFLKRWPRLADADWYPAIGDGAANNIGSGCVTKERAALMIGTSGALRVAYRGEPPEKIRDGLWCYRIDRERVIIGGALSDGGGLHSWLKENLRLPANAEKLIATRPPASHGLTFLPFLAGERSTGYNEYADGAVLGLRSTTSATDIAQAAMESVGYRFAEILDQLNSVKKVQEIYASGGALHASKVWTQMLSDILGRELTLVDVPEASLRGAILLALETIGNIDTIEQVYSQGGSVVMPDVKTHLAYSQARRRHQEVYALTIRQ
nr:FGGY family of carbohydrate kinases, C-terminal domain protein [uncultured bacterium]